ncbi:DUF4241 domain-containing protein [Bacillus lacus]|uniref:DUF4241 domain-containing protein n=1 Tax=Metabacillus lacus TaxID=1983721 RepID=A0A7X2J2Z5_9BACI|nr:DUF4241 domain-containing protein [Metabacillus lacus]MRX74339.1 DUF4241 domain-containing protein [Metabacillus lacus]
MDLTAKLLGTFQVNSGELVVTDPCYPPEELDEEGEELSLLLTPACKGEWIATAFLEEDGTVARLIAVHSGFQVRDEWMEMEIEIPVDSAQAGIFDADSYGRDEEISYEIENVQKLELNEEGLKYYAACCDITSTDDQGGVLESGAVTVSGLGDGLYPVFVQFDEEGKVAAAAIDFLLEEEE